MVNKAPNYPLEEAKDKLIELFTKIAKDQDDWEREQMRMLTKAELAIDDCRNNNCLKLHRNA